MNKLKSILALSILLVSTVLLSCKKNDNDTLTGSHKVVFKAIGSSGVNVGAAVYTDGTGKNESFTSLSGTTWTSTEYVIPSSAQVISFGANGIGPNASSTLTAEIWIDGVKRAEGKSTGTVLSASATYSFN
ncbi:hypothetical protein [Pedobacter agri]|uniref:BACON domain-containing protein n=1 Tax=Pedobacter agri TaxID=454586 RepID=A0A9X3DEY4_9SPHI|nr:hypothetical protein [Pedobacter agri]MCX3264906.1 hypothetical protein [Pedobacter agri]